MKKTNIIKCVMSLVFAGAITFPLFDTNILNAESSPLDFSRKDSQSTVNIASKDIVKIVSGQETITQVESNYLDKNGLNLKYENRIPSGSVETIYSGTNLLVYAKTYRYTDVQNRTITWYPYQAKLSNKIIDFAYDTISKEYVCSFDNVNEEEQVELIYSTSFSLDKDAINNMLNSTYYAAESYVLEDIVGKTNETNNKNQQKYNEELNAYNQYLQDYNQFLQDSAKYDEYFEAKQEYDEHKAIYDEYLSEYDNYVQQLASYNSYLVKYEKYVNYQNYLVEKARYDQEYQAYKEEYEKNKDTYDKINYQLSVMELITTEMTSLNRTIYNAVMGGTVTQVLANKEKLKQYGVSEYQIDKANDATVALRQLFSHYYNLTSNESKYAFYRKYYNDIKTNLINLLQALDTLYKYDIVKLAIQSKDRVPQYNILLSQLVVVCNAISITPVDDGTANKVIYTNNTLIGGKTVMANLENDCDFVDNDELAYPSVKIVYKEPPVEPTPVEEVEKVEAPTKVNHPGIEPTKVENPGDEPTEVSKPTEPTKVYEPTKPEVIVLDSEVLDLINAYTNKDIVKRKELIKNYQLDVTTSFTKQFKNINTVTVEFHDQNGQYIAKYTTDSGSYIDYDKALPTKSGDEVYSEYKFSHWVYKDLDGNDIDVLDIDNVTESGHVYPVFVGTTKRKYEITWIVDGSYEVELYEYGEMPSYKHELHRETDGFYYYEFESWDNEVVEVTENKKYRAQFHNYYLIDIGGNSPTIKYTTDKITINCSKFGEVDLQLGKLFEEMISTSNTKSLQIVTTKTSVLFSAAAVSKLKKNNFDKIEIIQINNSKNVYTYQIKLYDVNGNLMTDEYSMNVTFSGEYDTTRSLLHETNLIGEKSTLRATIRKNTILFKLTNNYLYEVYPIYSVATTTNKNVIVNVNTEISKAGEEILFEVTPSKDGIEIVQIIISDNDGNRITHNDGKFIMPTSDVFISVEVKRYTYTICFSVDGEIISYAVYQHGEEIRVPDDPFKMGDSKYTYNFVGWDKEITNAYSNVIYYAIFDVEEIVQPEPSPIVKVLDVVELVVFIVVVSVPLLIVLIVLLKKKVFSKGKTGKSLKK